jgi:hypothetical protein
MADDGDDDYLSDKFLTAVEPQKLQTYSEKRKETLRQSLLRDEQNRTKGRRQLELESREEGLSKSLFERAEDDKASGRGPEHKALSMMLKMGFKPGQALGIPASVDEGLVPIPTTSLSHDVPRQEPSVVQLGKGKGHLANPIPLTEWSGSLGLSPQMRAVAPLPSFLLLYSLSLSLVRQYGADFWARHDREERYRPWKARAVANGTRASGQGRQGCGRGGQGVLPGSLPPRI